MEKDHLSIKKVVKNLRNHSMIKTLGTCFNVLLQPICTDELSELFTLLLPLAPEKIQR